MLDLPFLMALAPHEKLTMPFSVGRQRLSKLKVTNAMQTECRSIPSILLTRVRISELDNHVLCCYDAYWSKSTSFALLDCQSPLTEPHKHTASHEVDRAVTCTTSIPNSDTSIAWTLAFTAPMIRIGISRGFVAEMI